MDEYLCSKCSREKEGECPNCEESICLDHSLRCGACMNQYCGKCLQKGAVCGVCEDPLDELSKLGDSVEAKKPEGGGSIRW